MPAGKRLVIEYVSGYIVNNDASADFVELDMLGTNGATVSDATFPAEPIHDSPTTYTVEREVRIYMSAGETVFSNPQNAQVTFYGTLDDA